MPKTIKDSMSSMTYGHTIILMVDKYLIEGEKVRQTFNIKGHEVHATNMRLFVSSLNGKTVQDYMYECISSMRFHEKHYRWLIGVGIAILGASLFYRLTNSTFLDFGYDLFWVGLAIGAACIVAGIILKKEAIIFHVIGVTGTPTFYGDRKDFDSLLKIIREMGQASENILIESDIK